MRGLSPRSSQNCRRSRLEVRSRLQPGATVLAPATPAPGGAGAHTSCLLPSLHTPSLTQRTCAHVPSLTPHPSCGFAPKVCRTSRRCFDLNDKCFRHTGGVLVNSRWFASEASAPPDTTHHKPARRRCAGSIVNAGWRCVPAPLPGCRFWRAVFRWCARWRSRTTGYSPAHLRCALSPRRCKAPARSDLRCKAPRVISDRRT